MTRVGLTTAEPLTIGAPAPLFAAIATGIGLGGAVLAVAVGGGTTSWPAEAVGLAVFAAAGAVLTVGARGFRGWTHLLVLLLLLLGTVLDDLAHRGGPPSLLDGPALVVVPLFLLVLGVLRPPREVLGVGALLAGAATAATVLLDPGGALQPARAVAAATAVLAPALAAWALGRTALSRLSAEAPQDPDPDAPVRLSVQQETVARLEAEAIPLLEGVLRAEAIGRDDAARAAGIAERLRAALIADLARGWLAEAGVQVVDPDGYAERMSIAQRTAVRAVLGAVPPGATARARVTGQDHDVQLVLDLPGASRRAVAPVLPLLRAAFAAADLRDAPDGARLTAGWGSRP